MPETQNPSGYDLCFEEFTVSSLADSVDEDKVQDNALPHQSSQEVSQQNGAVQPQVVWSLRLDD